MQITFLKFGGNWILHPKILKFGFYPLTFGSVWILHIDVSKFGFWLLYFLGVWILSSKIWNYLDFTP